MVVSSSAVRLAIKEIKMTDTWEVFRCVCPKARASKHNSRQRRRGLGQAHVDCHASAREREAWLAQIGRLTAAEGHRRTAANRSEARTPVARGGDGESAHRHGLERGDTTAAGGGGEARRMSDGERGVEWPRRCPREASRDTGRVMAMGFDERGADSDARLREDLDQELTDERERRRQTDGVAARQSRRRGGTTPRGRGRGTRGEWWRPELLVMCPRTHRFLRCSAADGDDEIRSSGDKAVTVECRFGRGNRHRAVERSAGGHGRCKSGGRRGCKERRRRWIGRLKSNHGSAGWRGQGGGGELACGGEKEEGELWLRVLDASAQGGVGTTRQQGTGGDRAAWRARTERLGVAEFRMAAAGSQRRCPPRRSLVRIAHGSFRNTSYVTMAMTVKEGELDLSDEVAQHELDNEACDISTL
uniref:Fibroin-like protein n=1 Tax=Oryza sativa subsp. japonica TaxID=39947 RepID=Q7XHU4_ORYSJ|nr:fibroin-like protein [Oryza sativa Japonica Group]